MHPNVPPDFLCVVDALRLDEQVDVLVVLAGAGKKIRNARAGEFVENLGAVRLEARVPPAPEGRIGG